MVFVAGAVLAQEPTTRPVQPEMKSFFVSTKGEFDTKVADWVFHSIMYADWDKLEVELTTSRPARPVNIGQCGNTPGVQQQTAKRFGPLADVYYYWAFFYTTEDKPAEGSLLWPGMDQPFLNHARKMRELVGDTPIVAQLHAHVAKGKEQRAASQEEIQWQFIAAAGCGYRGVLWPDAHEHTAWGGENLKQFAAKLHRHGRFLSQSKPVDWAKPDKTQGASGQHAKSRGISALACDEYLFVFLLHPAYMNLDADGKTVTIPLEKPPCEGTVTITLPKGITIRRGQTLEGKTIRLTTQDATTIVPYSFTSGGEMLIFTLAGKAEAADKTEP